MLDLSWAEGKLLASILDATMNVGTHANFNCSDAGLSIEQSDTNGLGKVSLFLPPFCFDRHRCHRNFAMKMNIKNAEKILMCSDYKDILTLKAVVGGKFVKFVFKNHDQGQTATFKMKRMNFDFKDDIAEIEFDTIFRISSHECARIWGNFSKISDTVRISVSKDCVRISSTGDIGNASINYWQNSRPEDAIILKMKEPVSSDLDIRHFWSFTMGFDLSSEVIISMSSGLHVLVEYQVAKFGRLRFYLPTRKWNPKGMPEMLIFKGFDTFFVLDLD